MYKSALVFFSCLALASAAPKCKNGVKEVKVNFDDVKSPNQNVKPPNGYGGLNWYSADVNYAPEAATKPMGESIPFAGVSKPNVLRAQGHTTSFTTSVQGTLDDFSLKSFDLACWTFISDVNLLPQKCSFLITVGDYYGLTKTFPYEYVEDDGKHPTFTHYTGPVLNGSSIKIELIGQPVGTYPLESSTVMNIDNVVTQQKC